MKLEYNLKLEQTQKLIITPELKLAIKLLQYSALELQDHIQEELLNNPVIEFQEPPEEEKGEESPAEASAEAIKDENEFPYEEYFRDRDLDTASGFSGGSAVSPEMPPSIDNCSGGSCSMFEDLLSQLRLLPLPQSNFSMAAFLAGNLDRNGYLQGDIEDLAETLGASARELEEALSIIQKLEPAGIGCRNLQECLLLQLERLDQGTIPDHTETIVRNYLPAAADQRYRYVASCIGCEIEAVSAAVAFIRTLNPKPGSIFGEGEETRYIVPDVIVDKVDHEYVVTINETSTPQLTISPFYQRMLQSSATDEQISSFIKSKIDKACWLIRSIEQRRLTLFRVSQEIVEIQKPFLEDGIRCLRSLTLKDVANKVGVHESTVSRATANKYIQTSRGLFPMKFFFSSGLVGRGGEDISSHSIKSQLGELVEAESPHKPLSDQRLTELLQDSGIEISRRTVAKYREEIGIPASYKRRRSS